MVIGVIAVGGDDLFIYISVHIGQYGRGSIQEKGHIAVKDNLPRIKLAVFQQHGAARISGGLDGLPDGLGVVGHAVALGAEVLYIIYPVLGHKPPGQGSAVVVHIQGVGLMGRKLQAADRV